MLGFARDPGGILTPTAGAEIHSAIQLRHGAVGVRGETEILK